MKRGAIRKIIPRPDLSRHGEMESWIVSVEELLAYKKVKRSPLASLFSRLLGASFFLSFHSFVSMANND
jgi:hypothetical protein